MPSPVCGKSEPTSSHLMNAINSVFNIFPKGRNVLKTLTMIVKEGTFNK
jgi:hypothetical protein